MEKNPSNFSLAKFHSKHFGLLWVNLSQSGWYERVLVLLSSSLRYILVFSSKRECGKDLSRSLSCVQGRGTTLELKATRSMWRMLGEPCGLIGSCCYIPFRGDCAMRMSWTKTNQSLLWKGIKFKLSLVSDTWPYLGYFAHVIKRRRTLLRLKLSLSPLDLIYTLNLKKSFFDYLVIFKFSAKLSKMT